MDTLHAHRWPTCRSNHSPTALSHPALSFLSLVAAARSPTVSVSGGGGLRRAAVAVSGERRWSQASGGCLRRAATSFCASTTSRPSSWARTAVEWAATVTLSCARPYQDKRHQIPSYGDGVVLRCGLLAAASSRRLPPPLRRLPGRAPVSPSMRAAAAALLRCGRAAVALLRCVRAMAALDKGARRRRPHTGVRDFRPARRRRRHEAA
jgi:hypothetical protein